MINVFTLTEAEQLLVDSCKNGEILDFQEKKIVSEITDSMFSENQIIRAEVIIALCININSEFKLHPKGIRLKGAKIINNLDFTACSLKSPLELINCLIVEKIVLINADAIVLKISGSKCYGINAEGLTLKGTLFIDSKFVCDGEISLLDAKIKGSINAAGARLNNPEKITLNAVRLSIEGGIFFSDKFKSIGQILLYDAKIGGSLSFFQSTLENRLKPCVEASRASIKGAVFFTEANCSGELTFIDTKIDGSLGFSGAVLDNGVNINLCATRAIVKGSIFFDKKFRSNGIVGLHFAQIGGSVDCTGATFYNPAETVLNAVGINIKGAFLLTEGVISNGSFNLSYGIVGGPLHIGHGDFSNPGNVIIDGFELTVKNSILFKSNFNGDGAIIFSGASVGGNISFHNGAYSYSKSYGIDFTRANIVHSVLFKDGFKTNSGVRMVGAKIGGNLECINAKFEKVESIAFDASQSLIAGSVRFNEISFAGETRLSGARINGDFKANQCEFVNLGGTALNANRVIINNDFVIWDSNLFGKLRIANSEIGTDLRLHNTKIESGESGMAIQATGLITRGGVFLASQFVSFGMLNFHSAKIHGLFDCSGATFLTSQEVEDQSQSGTSYKNILYDYSFIASNIEIGGTLQWVRMPSKPNGIVDFSGGKVGQLWDDLDSWPDDGKLMIENFTYATFYNPILTTNERLKWIRRQKKFSRQPYEQFIRVLKLQGHEKDAKKVSRAKQNDLRRYGELTWYSLTWNWFLDFTIGHGYQVWRILFFAIGIITIGAIIFNHAFNEGMMIIVKEKEPHPMFQAFMYSADVFLPIVDLRQDSYWLPKSSSCNKFYTNYFWIHIFFGWLLTTLSVAGLTGIVKRE